jgi:phage tail sheath protein FI
MAQLKFGSAGVTANEIDISGPLTSPPVGTPAGIVGTALNGPAFVPVTVGTLADWYSKFGETDGKKFGPLAVVEWLRNAQAVTYLRVLGVGDGKQRSDTDGTIARAGFVAGNEQPNPEAAVAGTVGKNPYANNGGVLGRTYFLGCFMSESAGSTVFSDAGLQGSGAGISGPAGSVAAAVPIVRGVIMAPSGVILTLSSSVKSIVSAAPASNFVAVESKVSGSHLGDVVLGSVNTPKQEFTLLLNGHQGLTASYPNVITASFDVTSNNYFVNALNTDPQKMQEAGHYLYASWDIHPVLAVVTGTKTLAEASGSGATGWGREPIAFLVSGSTTRNTFDATKPNYENFNDRFRHAKSPWFISQKFGGSAVNLFRLHTLDDGAGPSTQFKISIENIVPSSDPLNKFGSFNVVLREFTDRDLDKKTIVNEVFNGVNLDPSSDRYIAKVIGDVNAYYDFDREESAQKLVIEGNYENRSNYIRVEVHPDVENGFVDPVALPVGFRGVDHLVTSGSAPLAGANFNEKDALNVDGAFTHAVEPPLPFRKKVTINEVGSVKEQVESKFYWGVQFEHPQTLLKQNGSTLPNQSIKSFAKYFPDFAVDAKVLTGSNTGQSDSAQWGVIDADRFCNNLFTLENVQVVTGTTGLADFNKWKDATYVRGGNIVANDTNKTRALKVDDFLSNKQFIKYSTVMQGGFNGVNIFDADSEEINNAAVRADMDVTTGRGLSDGPNVKSYMKAIEIMKNVVNMDIQLLAIPGIREPIVTDAAVLAVEERFDALYIMDIEQLDENSEQVDSEDQLPSVTNTINNFKNRSVDTSFAAAYFPDVLYKDPKGINLQAPPSVLVLGAMALNDSVGHPWFAPAGFTRGALPQVALEPRVKLSQRDMDTLYDNSVNPIVAFPGAALGGLNPTGGIVVWGQKTLQVAASALDRVNVRRLLIEIRRQVRDIANAILFEPNREATLARFSAAVTPRLQRIQALSGLERFRVIIDSSTTTQDDIENNTIRGKIFVQPTKSIEFVSLDFVVANNLQQVT